MIFGNPPYQNVQAMKNSILLHQWKSQGILEPLLGMPYPCEITTQAELWDLVAKTRMISSHRLAWCQWIHTNLAEGWAQYVQTLGVTYEAEYFQNIFDQYDPISMYLKYYYNRPRPFQTAGYYGIPLYPHTDHPAGSSEAAYPSGHTFLSLIAYHTVGKVHPELRKDLMKFVMDVKLSREEMGVHYVSDGLFAFQVYRQVKKFL